MKAARPGSDWGRLGVRAGTRGSVSPYFAVVTEIGVVRWAAFHLKRLTVEVTPWLAGR